VKRRVWRGYKLQIKSTSLIGGVQGGRSTVVVKHKDVVVNALMF
jgi:hypothetical protein